MTYEQILGGRKSITIIEADKAKGFDGFKISYSPGSVTIGSLKQLSEADSLDTLVLGLLMHDLQWNLKDNDGKAVEATKEALEAVPLPILKMVSEAITEEESPKETNAEASPISS